MKRFVSLGVLGGIALAVSILYGLSLNNAPIFDDETLGRVVPQYGDLEFKLRAFSYGTFVWIGDVLGVDLFSVTQRAVNVIIHLGTVLGLFVLHCLLLRGALATVKPDSRAISCRVAVALGVALFALNPVAVYAVAYLAQRSIVMATFFVVWGLVFFTLALESRRLFWFAMVGSVLCYVCAMLSKEYAVAAPATAWAIYVYVRRPPLRTMFAVLLASLSLFGIALWLLTGLFPHLLGRPFDALSREFVLQLEQISPGSAENAWPLSILNQMSLFPRYLVLWMAPWTGWMSVDLRPTFPLGFMSWPHLAGAALYLGALFGGLTGLMLARSIQARFISLALFVPATLFATEFVTVWIQDPFVLYRSYLWAIMLPGVFALGFRRLRLDNALMAGGVLALAFGLLAADRVVSLRNSFTVWNDAAEKVDLAASENAVGRWRAFMNRGSFHLANQALASAAADFEVAARLGEPLGTAHYSLGVVRNIEGRADEALVALNTAEQSGFRDAALYYQRAIAQRKLGRQEAALADYTEMIKRATDPRVRLLGHRERGELALQAGRGDLVTEDVEALLAENPEQPELLFNLGMLHISGKNFEAAKEAFRTLLRGNPSSAPAHYGLALAYFMSGELADARFMIDRAVVLDRDNALYQRLAQDIHRQAGARAP